MKRIRLLFLAIVSVVVISAVVGVGTFALFSDSALNNANSFQAGTLSIDVDKPGTWSVNFENMAPGDTVSKTITVKNTGSLDLEFATSATRTGALFTGAGRATYALLNAYGTLAPGATQDVTVQVTLPLSAANSYQSAQGTMNITFFAFQTRNLTAGAATATLLSTADAVYNKYEFRDAGGNLIPLTDANLLGLYEMQPGGTSMRLVTTVGDNDPYLWFNKSKPAGTYSYVIVTKSGMRYTASFNH